MTKQTQQEQSNREVDLTIQELDSENLCDICNRKMTDGEAIYEIGNEGKYGCQECYENIGERAESRLEDR